MSYYIGIDLGTSAMKLLLVDENGAILNAVTKEYPLLLPQPGWSEQDPGEWWSACVEGMRALLDGFDASAVAGIGCGGQMHGLVVLDEQGYSWGAGLLSRPLCLGHRRLERRA